jgi:hypothetical protein
LVEADFLRFYGMDLRVEVGRSSVRRLVALIRALPEDSATARLSSQPSQDSGESKKMITSGAAFAGWIGKHAKKA